MTKAKFIRLKQIVARINDPTLKRMDRLQEAARLPCIDLQQFLKVCKTNGIGLENFVPKEQLHKVGEQLMQACRLNKIASSEFQLITKSLCESR